MMSDNETAKVSRHSGQTKDSHRSRPQAMKTLFRQFSPIAFQFFPLADKAVLLRKSVNSRESLLDLLLP